MKNSACVGCVHLLNFHLEAPFSRYISFLNDCSGGPIEEFLSLCELAMNLSSHQIIVSLRGQIKLRYPYELDIYFKFIKISDLICELEISFDLQYNSGSSSIYRAKTN